MCGACGSACPSMCLPMPTMMPTVMPPAMMLPMMLPMMIPMMMAAMATKAKMFKSAMKKLKKMKNMEKKMAMKAYKKGKKVIMARMMAGQAPQPSDFINGRDEYSYFEFPMLPGVPELPPIFPRPGDVEITDYINLFKMMNKKGKGKMD